MDTVANKMDTFRTLHIVYGILCCVFGFFPIIYIGIGAFVMTLPDFSDVDEMPFNPGIIFVIVGLFIMLMVIVMAVLNFLAARFIRERKNSQMLMVISVLNCLTGVLGILLGVFMIVELTKEETKEYFGERIPGNRTN